SYLLSSIFDSVSLGIAPPHRLLRLRIGGILGECLSILKRCDDALIDLVVLASVRQQAGGLSLDQRRPFAGAGARCGSVSGGVDRNDIIAVDDHAREAVAGGAIGDIF